jgi:hypothetical protein
MDNQTNTFFTYAIALALLYLVYYAITRHLVPGPYRILARVGRRVRKPLVNFLIVTQLTRRGVVHTLLVHLPAVSSILLIATGIATNTGPAVLIGVFMLTFAALSHRFLTRVRRLSSRRHTLPGWRT